MGDGMAETKGRVKESLGKFEASGRGEEVLEIPLTHVGPNRHQPRQVFDHRELESLADSIRARGILMPILVRRSDDPEYGFPFELVAGERRLRAARLAGLETVPALVRAVEDGDMRSAALVENVHRKELNVLEKMMAFKMLEEELGSCDRVSEETGVTYRTVRKYLSVYDSLAKSEEIMGIFREQAALIDHDTACDFARCVPNILKLKKADNRAFQRLLKKLVKKGVKGATSELVKRFSDQGKEDGGSGNAGYFRETKGDFILHVKARKIGVSSDVKSEMAKAVDAFLEALRAIPDDDGDGEDSGIVE
jgi:ParB/RepB/Spo0J family partition protein